MKEHTVQPCASNAGTSLEHPRFLGNEELQYFSQLSSLKFMLAVVSEILTISLAVWVSETYRNPFLYFLVVVIIGSRLHALGILMHDATHYRAFSKRWLNDIVGELLAWPVTLTLQGYRNVHLPHHRTLNSEDDPNFVGKKGRAEFVFPQSPRALILTLMQYAIGLKLYGEIKSLQTSKVQIKKISLRLQIVQALFFVALFSVAIIFGFWMQVLAYWLVPVFSALLLFVYIRSVAEHDALACTHMLNSTRTVLAPSWERWLFAPHGVNYHLEHHLYPSVPFFRLAELHHCLMKNEAYAESAHITKGYVTGLFRECSRATHPVAKQAS